MERQERKALAKYIMDTAELCIAQTGRKPTIDDWKCHFECDEFQTLVTANMTADEIINYILLYFAILNPSEN